MSQEIRTVTDLLANIEPVVRGWIEQMIGDNAASNDPGDQFEFEFASLADGDTLYYDGTAFEWKNNSLLQIDPSNSIVTVSNGVLYIDDGNAVAAALKTSDFSIISAQGTAPGLSIVAASSDDAQHRGVMKGVRSRGTLASPTVPSVDDSVFSILGAIYDGVDTEGTAQIDFIVDGAVSSNVAPQRIAFMTSETTAGNRVDRLQIKSDGTIIINDTSADINVVIRSDTDTAMFVMDGGLNVISIGAAADASYKFKVTGAIGFDGDLTFIGAQKITTTAGDFTVDSAANFVIEDNTIIDITSTEAFLVRKNADAGDIFVVDTSSGLVGILGASAGANLDITGNMMIDGSADEVQLTVQGHSTQTSNNLVVFENSSGTDVYSWDGFGGNVQEYTRTAGAAESGEWKGHKWTMTMNGDLSNLGSALTTIQSVTKLNSTVARGRSNFGVLFRISVLGEAINHEVVAGYFEAQIESNTAGSHVDDLIGGDFKAFSQAARASYAVNIIGGRFLVEASSTGNVTFTALKGLEVLSAVSQGSGTETITNLYGLFIRDQTIGSTNYAIYTGSGTISFGDDLAFRQAAIVSTASGDLELNPAGVTTIGGASPTNATLFSVEDGITFKESAAPTADAGYGKIWTTTVNELFFQSGDGSTHLLHGDAFSNIWYHGITTVEVAISTQNAMTIIDSFTVVGNEDDLANVVGSSANNTLTISSIAAGEYECSFHASVTATGGADKEMVVAMGVVLATAKDITNVTDDTVTPIVITSVAHGLENGDMVEIAGVLGNTAANGSFIVDSKAADTFTIVKLDGSATTGNGNFDEGSPTGDVTIVYVGNMIIHREVRGADLGAISATGVHVLSNSDVLSLYVANLDGTTNLTVGAVSLDAFRIGD